MNDTMLDSMIAPTDWCVFRRDRGGSRKGGGVAIMCKNNPHIVFKRVELPSRFNKLEIVVIDILTGNANGTRLIVAYYPPDLLSDICMCRLLLSAFMYIGNTNLTVCIVGDLNLPLMDWVNGSSPNNDIYIEFLSYFNHNSFVQLVNFPTRNNNLLDVILTDNPQQINNIHSLPPIGNSDHLTIVCNLIIDTDTVCNLAIEPPSVLAYDNYDFTNYKFERADWHNINIALSTIDWYYVFGVGISIEECWDSFCSILHNIFEFYIPKKHAHKQFKYGRSGAKKTTKRKTYSNKIRRAMSGKLKAWRTFKLDRSSTKKAKFNISSKKLKNEIFKFDIDKEKKVIESGSAREFFKYVKRKTTCREVIPPLSKENNEYAYSDLEKASILNNYFCSVFTKDNYVLPDFSVSKVENNNLCLNNIYFSDYIVAQKI